MSGPKTCPFCGCYPNYPKEDAYQPGGGEPFWRVTCRGCTASVRGKSGNDALEAWNMREGALS